MKKGIFSIFSLIALILISGCATTTEPAKKAPLPKVTKAVTIHLVGDSTCATYRPNRAPLTGWGQVLGQYVSSPLVEIRNHSRSGYSTNSFIQSKRWDRIVKAIKPGDYVVIQLGHNDGGARKNTKRYADVKTDYPANLTRFIQDVRGKKGIPILATSIAKRVFKDGKVAPNYLLTYRDAVLRIGSQFNVPVIDLNKATIDMLNAMGEKKAEALYLGPVYAKKKPGSTAKPKLRYIDRTHLNLKGAHEVAKLFVAECAKRELPISACFK